MITIIHPWIASLNVYESFSEESPPDELPAISLNNISPRHFYVIESSCRSESAVLFFARHKDTKERVVIKVLRSYEDARYSLATVGERQQCQLEALHWNRIFTPDIYIGLARICELNPQQGRIGISEIISNPTREMLEPQAEYGLLMHELPADMRLDYLLEKENEDRPWCYLQLLTKCVARIHERLPALSNLMEGEIWWGSPIQLRQKLAHNLELSEPILVEDKSDRYNILHLLRDALLKVHTQDQYRQYFEHRVQEGRIKRCHGDLKTTNIWITPYASSPHLESCEHVWILDAIDFRTMYTNIDVLSDFAMLVIDVQVRTQSVLLADLMIKEYLQFTGQQDQVAKSVLAYYLVEKALVGATVNILYDNLPDLGLAYLKVAEMRSEELQRWVYS